MIGIENEELHGWIWTKLGNGDSPSIIVIAETHDGAPSCVNAVHIVDLGKLHHLLPFDGASNMVNEEN